MQTNIKIILSVMIIVVLIFSLAKGISFSIYYSIEIILIAILDFLNNYEFCSSGRLNRD